MAQKLNKLKGVIFDFDGTLVSIHIDFKKLKKDLLKKAEKTCLQIPDKNLPILEFLEYIRKNNSKNEETEDFISDINRALLNEEIRSAEKAIPLPGSLKLIKDLSEKGVKTGIFTRNCKQAVNCVIEKFNIYCDIVITRDDVCNVKPAREHLEKTAGLLGLNNDEIIVVGDHPMDIKSAKNFQALSCGIVSEYFTRYDFEQEDADFIFENLEDIGYLFGIKPLKTGKLPNCLLEYLLKTYIKNDSSVIEGPKIGVDCAVFQPGADTLFAKTDPITLVGSDIGTYLVNVNINDILVMGGIPRWFLCSLLFHQGITLNEIEDVFSQISYHCNKYNINWVGGHTEISEAVKNNVACGFLTGVNIKKKHKTEQTIKEGDKVFLVREVGIEAVSIIAREKYEVLKEHFQEDILVRLVNSINNPGINILNEAKLLWENFSIKAMHDPTEGGLSTALYELAYRYKIGIKLKEEKLIFHPYIWELASIFDLNPYGIISSGCIVGIIGANQAEIMVEFMKAKGAKCAIIGEVIDKEGVYIDDGKEEKKLIVFERDEITKL